MARRSALLGLAGIGAAAVGIAGWKLLENTGEPTSPAAARTPASPTLSGRDPSPSPEGSEPSALPKVPDKLTMQTHPGPGTTVEGYVTDRDAEIAYARFGEPWQKADLAPFTYAQRAGAAGFPQALIGSAPYPEAVPGALTDHADHADYRDLAARAAQWSLRYQPPGSAITWNASEVVRRGMGWLLGYSVDYLADGRQRTSLAVVAVVNSESRKPAMLFATVPDDQPALYRDLNMLIWSLVPV